jgi:hypothetical protein
MRHYRCQKDVEEIAQALPGPGREAQRFVPQQALALFDFSTAQLSECDAQIEHAFSGIQPRFDSAPAAPWPPRPTPPPRKPHAHRQNAPASHTRAPLLRMPGVDLVAVHGIRTSIAQTIRSEIGPEMRQGPDETHCWSWRGRAPKKESSGRTVLKSRTMKTRNRAAHAFRMAAQSVLRAAWALGAFSRRWQGRLGPAQALVATAHKMARTGYHLLTDRVPYHDIGATESTKRFRERALQYLQKKAAKLGYTLSLAD